MSTETAEKKTIREVESIVHASGDWDGTGPVEFSDDGVTWTQAWFPTIITGTGGEIINTVIPHPEFARVEVYRKGVRIPTTVTIRWDEQYPAASEEWSAKWDHSPMRHFGRTVRMVAFRQTFRDLLGDIRIEEEFDDRDLPAQPDAQPVERDWAAEIADAKTTEQLDAIDAEGRALRVFKPNAEGTALHLALKNRRRELAAGTWDMPIDLPADYSVGVKAPDGVGVTDEPAGRTKPRDYLPPAGNRAARRKAARKKGGKR